MQIISPEELYQWCKIHVDNLEQTPKIKIPFRICNNSSEMGTLMARELVDEIKTNNEKGKSTRAIIPCGPSSWYKPFVEIVNEEKVSSKLS